jgi:6-phosphogluconolactonase
MTVAIGSLSRTAALVLGVALMLATTPARCAAPPTKARVYVGTYTDTASQGIYRFDLDLTTGAMSTPTLAAAMRNPTFLQLDPTRAHLYAVGEVESADGKKGGFVNAYRVDPETGALSLINSQSTVGGGPCHVTVDKAGKNVLVANYGGGSVAVLPIVEGGGLAPASSFVQHHGKGPNRQRQEGPHAHSINLDPANRFAFVCDLGLDKVLVYRFDAEKGTLAPNDPPAAQLAPGAGPRHFTFHPDGKHAYAINELDSTLTAFTYDPERGVLTETQTISTLPAGSHGTNYPADVHVHPDGKVVYGSNRGHDSIAMFHLDPAAGGKLVFAGTQGEGIKNPRNFGLDPTSRWILVASQDADTVRVFGIEPQTGALIPTPHVVKVSKPVCVQFVPLTDR